MRERFAAAVERTPALAAALAPYDACGGCRAVCRHRTVSETLARQSTTAETFGHQLDGIPVGPESGAVTRWHLDVSAWLGGLLDDAGAPSGPDARACLFLHACRALGTGRGHLTPLVRRHRAEISA